jgi:hypothetical protein
MQIRTIRHIPRDMERLISWQHFPRKEKRKNKNKARMDIGGMNFCSLGVLEPNRKKKEEVKDNKAELENLADIIKQAMFEDYRLAYSEEGDAHKEEAESTVTVG